MSKVRISLCMIVRDEEAMLGRFLACARGAWDELVAVDTGSVDATPDLLAAAGARVLREPWGDDFAAARNVGLEAATGDWILVLDADEMAPPDLAPSLRAAAADPQIGAATLLIRNRLAHGHVHDTRLVRAFRRDPAIRFRHAIHEDAVGDVLAVLKRDARRLAHLAAPVEHLGYGRDRARERNKKERDVRILEKCLAADPLDLYSHFKRLEQARFWSDRELWKRAAEAASEAMAAARERLADAHFGGELARLVADGLHPDDPGRALAILDAWEPLVPPSAALYLRRGELRELQGLETAAEDFRRCLELGAVTPNQQLATVRPLGGLGRLAMGRGDFGGALDRFREALALAPRDPELLLGTVVLLRQTGGAAAVLAFAADHARRHGETVELLSAVGEAALLAGDAEVGRALLERAARLEAAAV